MIRVLLTVYADFERLAAAINNAGIFRFVSKPWRDEELRQVLHQAAELYRLRKDNQGTGVASATRARYAGRPEAIPD